MNDYFKYREFVQGTKNQGKINEIQKELPESAFKLYVLPKQRLQSAYIGRASKRINGRHEQVKPKENEMDCLLEFEKT